MFDEFGGLPLHPLVIHVVVLSIPLTLVLAVAFALSRFRSWARWVLALVAVGSLVATLVAKESGEALQAALRIRPGDPRGPLVAQHSALADQLVWLVAGMSVLAVLAALLVDRRPAGRTAVGRGPADRTPADRTPAQRALDLALPLALILVAALASFWAYRVGDLGAQAVWNPAGTQNYQVEGEG